MDIQAVRLTLRDAATFLEDAMTIEAWMRSVSGLSYYDRLKRCDQVREARARLKLELAKESPEWNEDSAEDARSCETFEDWLDFADGWPDDIVGRATRPNSFSAWPEKNDAWIKYECRAMTSKAGLVAESISAIFQDFDTRPIGAFAALARQAWRDFPELDPDQSAFEVHLGRLNTTIEAFHASVNLHYPDAIEPTEPKRSPVPPNGPEASADVQQAIGTPSGGQVATTAGKLTAGSRALAAAKDLRDEGQRVNLYAACKRAGVDRPNVRKRYPDVVKAIEALAAPDRQPRRGMRDRRTGNVEAIDGSDD